jgi:AraC-like DNA-binding protein
MPCEELLPLLGENRLQKILKEALHDMQPISMDELITPEMHLLIKQMKDINDSAQANCGPFAVAKGLELLWLFSRAWDADVQPPVSRQDVEAIDKARSILEKNLDEPPSLEKLASQVGMSLSKFKQVFRQSYDMPPYAYLRKVRLEKAMCLLQLQGASVTQTALEVGYNSISHFAKAFASHFGVLPSEVRKRFVQDNRSVSA